MAVLTPARWGLGCRGSLELCALRQAGNAQNLRGRLKSFQKFASIDAFFHNHFFPNATSPAEVPTRSAPQPEWLRGRTLLLENAANRPYKRGANFERIFCFHDPLVGLKSLLHTDLNQSTNSVTVTEASLCFDDRAAIEQGRLLIKEVGSGQIERQVAKQP